MNTNYSRHDLQRQSRILYIAAQTVRVIGMLALLVAIAIHLTACGPTRPVVKSIAVEVPREVRVPVDASLLQPCVVAEPDPACWDGTTRVFCNGQLATMRQQYREALRLCTADKAAIRGGAQ
jgi:hypothetical protein